MVDEAALQKLVDAYDDETDLQELAGCAQINFVDRFKELALKDAMFAVGWAQVAALVKLVAKGNG